MAHFKKKSQLWPKDAPHQLDLLRHSYQILKEFERSALEELREPAAKRLANVHQVEVFTRLLKAFEIVLNHTHESHKDDADRKVISECDQLCDLFRNKISCLYALPLQNIFLPLRRLEPVLSSPLAGLVSYIYDVKLRECWSRDLNQFSHDKKEKIIGHAWEKILIAFGDGIKLHVNKTEQNESLSQFQEIAGKALCKFISELLSCKETDNTVGPSEQLKRAFAEALEALSGGSQANKELVRSPLTFGPVILSEVILKHSDFITSNIALQLAFSVAPLEKGVGKKTSLKEEARKRRAAWFGQVFPVLKAGANISDDLVSSLVGMTSKQFWNAMDQIHNKIVGDDYSKARAVPVITGFIDGKKLQWNELTVPVLKNTVQFNSCSLTWCSLSSSGTINSLVIEELAEIEYEAVISSQLSLEKSKILGTEVLNWTLELKNQVSNNGSLLTFPNDFKHGNAYAKLTLQFEPKYTVTLQKIFEARKRKFIHCRGDSEKLLIEPKRQEKGQHLDQISAHTQETPKRNLSKISISKEPVRALEAYDFSNVGHSGHNPSNSYERVAQVQREALSDISAEDNCSLGLRESPQAKVQSRQMDFAREKFDEISACSASPIAEKQYSSEISPKAVTSSEGMSPKRLEKNSNILSLSSGSSYPKRKSYSRKEKRTDSMEFSRDSNSSNESQDEIIRGKISAPFRTKIRKPDRSINIIQKKVENSTNLSAKKPSKKHKFHNVSHENRKAHHVEAMIESDEGFEPQGNYSNSIRTEEEPSNDLFPVQTRKKAKEVNVVILDSSESEDMPSKHKKKIIHSDRRNKRHNGQYISPVHDSPGSSWSNDESIDTGPTVSENSGVEGKEQAKLQIERQLRFESPAFRTKKRKTLKPNSSVKNYKKKPRHDEHRAFKDRITTISYEKKKGFPQMSQMLKNPSGGHIRETRPQNSRLSNRDFEKELEDLQLRGASDSKSSLFSKINLRNKESTPKNGLLRAIQTEEIELNNFVQHEPSRVSPWHKTNDFKLDSPLLGETQKDKYNFLFNATPLLNQLKQNNKVFDSGLKMQESNSDKLKSKGKEKVSRASKHETNLSECMGKLTQMVVDNIGSKRAKLQHTAFRNQIGILNLTNNLVKDCIKQSEEVSTFILQSVNQRQKKYEEIHEALKHTYQKMERDVRWVSKYENENQEML
ncbi:hypothetical protein O181_002253 [Austropuccinia psidii MF-1]|uniref:Uncharacterized protein n=1 Tax=Austropuccinia psidii MF-1 TaxID=1389203 RepID=A0A9Q3BCD7_9BASI|nr:hypothetical protein [Austropuccinia psidii MF-1]